MGDVSVSDEKQMSLKQKYGSAELEIHKNDIRKNWNILIHDDLLATGGTAAATAELINKLNAKVVGFALKTQYIRGVNTALWKPSKTLCKL